jgi:hypothetical protein
MAVHTSHVALFDLLQDRCPHPFRRKPANVSDLLGRQAMIELKDDNVRFATVDARMRQEIPIQLLAVFVAAPLDLRDRTSDVVGLVLEVVLAAKRCVTHPAVALQEAPLDVAERESS